MEKRFHLLAVKRRHTSKFHVHYSETPPKFLFTYLPWKIDLINPFYLYDQYSFVCKG